MKFIKIYKLLFFIGALLAFNACSDDDAELGPAPTSGFVVDESSVQKQGYEVSFSSQSTGGKSYFWSFGDGNTVYGENVTHVYSMPGTYTVTLETSANGQRAIAQQEISIAPIELFFINNTDFQVQKISISDPENVTPVFDLPGFSFGLTFDAAADELYFSDDDNLKVFKNNLQGDNEVEIASDLNGPRDIALDLSNNRIFVTERSGDRITQINVDNGNKSTLYSVADDSFFLLPVGLDLHNSNIYVTAVDFDAETVWKGNIDGSGISKIINYSDGGFGYGLEVDKVNNRIYFDDADGGVLLSSNLNGGDIQSIGTSSDRVYGIAIENQIGKVFWASRDGIIKSANLDGSDERVLAELSVDIRGLIVR